MGYENTAGLGVNNQYGKRDTGGSVGLERSDNSVHVLSINITGAMLNGTFIPPVYMPKGALVKSYRLRVDEAFNLGGTTPTVRFGSSGSVATNGVVLSETELENIGTKVPASAGAGTWSTTSSTGLTAAARVAFDMGGGSPTASATVGKATLMIEYVFKTKV